MLILMSSGTADHTNLLYKLLASGLCSGWWQLDDANGSRLVFMLIWVATDSDLFGQQLWILRIVDISWMRSFCGTTWQRWTRQRMKHLPIYNIPVCVPDILISNGNDGLSTSCNLTYFLLNCPTAQEMTTRHLVPAYMTPLTWCIIVGVARKGLHW